jgi:hypothetical protein
MGTGTQLQRVILARFAHCVVIHEDVCSVRRDRRGSRNFGPSANLGWQAVETRS